MIESSSIRQFRFTISPTVL